MRVIKYSEHEDGSATINVDLTENEYYMAWFVAAETSTLIRVSTLMMTDGSYGFSPNIFYVEDPDNKRTGKLISFYLGGRVINGI